MTVFDDEHLVLCIDDEPTFAETTAHFLSEAGVPAVGRHPQDVTFADLESAAFVVVDEFLEHWVRPAAPATMTPADGLAVAAVLRSQKSALCVAVLTGALAQLADGVPVAFGEHHIAALRDVEWVFSKTDVDVNARLAMLATAVGTLPEGLDARSIIRWLQPPDEAWVEGAIEQITRCRPPLAPRQDSSGSRPILRWLLQKILPYPTFLLSDGRAALLLGIDPAALDELAPSEPFERITYDGPLAGFLGRRWWRAGLDDVLDNPELSSLVDPLRRANASDRLVMTLSEDLQELRPAPVAECARIYPDGWPPYADQAWAFAEDVVPESVYVEMSGLPLEFGAVVDH